MTHSTACCTLQHLVEFLVFQPFSASILGQCPTKYCMNYSSTSNDCVGLHFQTLQHLIEALLASACFSCLLSTGRRGCVSTDGLPDWSGSSCALALSEFCPPTVFVDHLLFLVKFALLPAVLSACDGKLELGSGLLRVLNQPAGPAKC